jgi:ABC-type multidrug transport system ATPase subunit
LDARSSRIVKDIISMHSKKNNGAVLFSTHIMEVAEHICDRIGIIYQGKLVAEGSLEELRREANAITVSSSSSTASGGGVVNEENSRGKGANATTLEEVFLKLTPSAETI